MKILKSFKLFEANRIEDVPNHFIPLESIGHYLDPISGEIYAMLKAGGYDDEGYPFSDDAENISDEEMALVNQYWKSCEDIFKPLIDWNIIDDIKDVALANEILDKGYNIRIIVKDGYLGESVYVEWLSHEENPHHYYKFFQRLYSQLEDHEHWGVSYYISVFRKNGPGGYLPAHGDDEKDVIEMIEQIKDMNPEKARKISYSKY
jgi:hypothetical protein